MGGEHTGLYPAEKIGGFTLSFTTLLGNAPEKGRLSRSSDPRAVSESERSWPALPSVSVPLLPPAHLFAEPVFSGGECAAP